MSYVLILVASGVARRGTDILFRAGVTASLEPLQVEISGTHLSVDCGVVGNTAGFG